MSDNTKTIVSNEKKKYEKPQAKKHKSVAVVSGSSCGSYTSTTSGDTYYY